MKERTYSFLRRFVDSPYAMKIDLKDHRVSMDGYDNVDIVSQEEKEALKMELAAP